MDKARLLLVFPEPWANGATPLSGVMAERFCRLSGRTLEELLELAEPLVVRAERIRPKRNLTKTEVAAFLVEHPLAGRRALLVGKATAFGFGIPLTRPMLAWRELAGGRVAVFPHPIQARWRPDETKRASELLCAALESKEAVVEKANPGRPDSHIEAEVRRRKKALFLEAFRQLGNRTYAAMHAGTDLKQVRLWQDDDPAFSEEIREAGLEACDRIEQEAYRRAIVGVEKPVIHQGKLCYRTDHLGNIEVDAAGKPLLLMEREWSDELLKLLLRGAKPEKYARSAFEISGPGGGPIPVAQVHVVLPANGRELKPALRAIEGGKP